MGGSLLGDLVSKDTTRGYTSITRRPINNFIETGVIYHKALSDKAEFGSAIGYMTGRSKIEEIRPLLLDLYYDYNLQSFFIQPYFNIPIGKRLGFNIAYKLAHNSVISYRTNDLKSETQRNFRSTHLNLGFKYAIIKNLSLETDMGYFNESSEIKRHGVRFPSSPTASIGLSYQVKK